MPTEMSRAWLDRVVTARSRQQQARQLLFTLHKLVLHGDADNELYSEEASDVLHHDGTQWRHEACSDRLSALGAELGQAVRAGTGVGVVLMGLTEVIDALNETILDTEALLSDVGVGEDPFIDRLEEHPTYERG